MNAPVWVRPGGPGIRVLRRSTLAFGLGLVLLCPFVHGGATGGRSLDAVEVVDLPEVDLQSTRAEDAARELAGLPPRFAIAQAVTLRPSDQGTWESLEGGELRWRLGTVVVGCRPLPPQPLLRLPGSRHLPRDTGNDNWRFKNRACLQSWGALCRCAALRLTASRIASGRSPTS